MLALECKAIQKSFYKRQRNKETGPKKAPQKAGTHKPSAKDGRTGKGRLLSWSRPRAERVTAVEKTSFGVDKGEIFGILGPNGSGKSTLIRLAATLLLPDAGEMRIFGHDVVRERMAVRRLINRVSVEASFFKKLSAMENLVYSARLYDVPAARTRREATAIMERLSLEHEKMYCPLEELSRGMQQKVAIARALLTSPVLMLLDEPTTGLDPKSKRDVQRFVLQVRKEHDATVILTTHDMQEAERLCDRVAIIERGQFVAMDTPDNLKRSLGRPGPVDLEDVFFELTGKDWEEVNAV